MLHRQGMCWGICGHCPSGSGWPPTTHLGGARHGFAPSGTPGCIWLTYSSAYSPSLPSVATFVFKRVANGLIAHLMTANGCRCTISTGQNPIPAKFCLGCGMVATGCSPAITSRLTGMPGHLGATSIGAVTLLKLQATWCTWPKPNYGTYH